MSAQVDMSKLIAAQGRMRDRAIAAAVRALNLAGEHVIGDAQQLTPVDTGALQASGTTRPAEVKGTTIEKLIGFNTSYAAAVHENLTAHHDVGQAKYLETAVRRSAAKVTDFVAAKVREAMK